MSKVRLDLTHYELAVIRSLLGKTNDTLGVSELFHRVSEKTESLGIKRVETKFENFNGITHAIGKE